MLKWLKHLTSIITQKPLPLALTVAVCQKRKGNCKGRVSLASYVRILYHKKSPPFYSLVFAGTKEGGVSQYVVPLL